MERRPYPMTAAVEQTYAAPAPRQTLLEWLAGSVVADVPNSRLASALRAGRGGSSIDWLLGAAEVLGWEADAVQAAPRAIGGEREAWWVTCASGERERWVVFTGERGREARASVIDGQTARDVSVRPDALADVLELSDASEAVTWVRLAPGLPLASLRSEPEDPELSPFRRLRRWVRLERVTVLAVVAYSAVIGVISLALPLAVQSLVNSLALGRLLQPLIVISLGLLFLLGMAAALRVLEVYIVELMQRRMFADVSRDVARRLPAALHEAGGKWGLTERINRFFDVVGAQKSASFLLLTSTEVVMSTIAGLLVLAFYHPYLLVFDLVLILALGLSVFRLGRGGVRTAVEESHAKYELAAWLESIARRKRRFASPDGASWAARKTDRLLVDWLHERSEHFRIVLRQTVAFAAIQAIASAALLGLGGFLVWNRQLSLGQLVAAELIITGVLAQLAKLGKHVESFYDLNASVDKIGILLDLDTEPAFGELLERGRDGIRVEVRDVELDGRRCELRVEPGERVGIVGMPHLPRQRLLDSIYGTQLLESGQILLDGVAITSLAPRARRRQIALVHEVVPVGATLEENLASQDSQATAGDLRTVLERVGLGSLSQELSDGLQTWIHPDGRPLSRTQLVSLEVARAILREPRLMLVNHALDAVGVEQAETLWNALAGPDASWTLVIASERDDVLARCDRVVRWSEDGFREVHR